MLESIKQYAEALSGLTEVPRDRARKIAESLSKQGVIPSGRIRGVAKGIVTRSRQNRQRLARLVSAQVRRQAGALGLATAEEIERLRRRVIALEGGPGRRAGTTSAAAAPRKPAVGTASRKPAAKSAGAARKRAAKPATRATAKSLTKRTAGKRPAGKRPAGKRVAAATRSRAAARKRPAARAASKRRR